MLSIAMIIVERNIIEKINRIMDQTSHWRLTEYEYDGHKATHDYRMWKPK